jgi:hypothetical protein
VQRERRHRRDWPWLRIDHGDGLRGNHADRRRSASAEQTLGETKRRVMHWSGGEEQRTIDAKC